MPKALRMSHVSFAYPGCPGGGEESVPVLEDVSLELEEGDFAVLVGATGSGKTTLLRLAKPQISPTGRREGELEVAGRSVGLLAEDPALSAALVGYVFQDPWAQLVCDGVLQELSFGLENLAVPQGELRRRIAETSYFLGMGPWLHARCAELSGGQLQVLALASVLAMRPRLLLLDEPTAMLDPVGEGEFVSLLRKANRELGITVLVATHRPLPFADSATRALSLEEGRVTELPTEELGGRQELDLRARAPRRGPSPAKGLSLRNLWFRHARDADWVLRGLDLSLARGECRALVGANGCGKSTLLSLVAGTLRPQRGGVRKARGITQALLPQSPKALLSLPSVGEELMEWSSRCGYAGGDVELVLSELGLGTSLLERHPYDLSGGQQQLVALAKLLLTRPDLLLLDEPSKGLDLAARRSLAMAVYAACERGATVLLATHDLELARGLADTVTLLFDGQAAITEPSQEFFENSWLWR